MLLGNLKKPGGLLRKTLQNLLVVLDNRSVIELVYCRGSFMCYGIIKPSFHSRLVI